MELASNQVVIMPEQLRRFCVAVLERVGQAPEHARIVADTLVRADLRGVHSHGMIRFPFYVRRLVDGGSKLRPDIRILREAAATALLDGDGGMGQIVTVRATEIAIDKARCAGLGFVAITNSDHFGAAAYYAMRMLDAGMIGLVWCNGPRVMAPWGGCSAAIGNNPLAVAIPAGRFDPIVLDMAMSRVSGGKVRLASKKGEKIPTDWIVSKSGRTTDNPDDLSKGGALMALGYKGYGLAVVGEVLCGALPGAGILSQIPVWFADTASPTNTGHLVMAVNIEAFVELGDFVKRVDSIVEELKACKAAGGFDEVLVPGELEARTERRQTVEGIALAPQVVADLEKVATAYGVPFEVRPRSSN